LDTASASQVAGKIVYSMRGEEPRGKRWSLRAYTFFPVFYSSGWVITIIA
jgi:hypothetical protein